MHGIVTIGPDGTLSLAGPYTSDKLANRHAKKLREANPGLNVEVHSMQAPLDLAYELRQQDAL
jgi:hypothetical protein